MSSNKKKLTHISLIKICNNCCFAGKRFGLLQSKVGLITILRNYEITLDKKTSDLFKFEPNELILRKTGDVWIKLKHIQT